MRFVPEYPPIGTDPVLAEWIYRELSRLSNAVTSNINLVELPKTYAEPAKVTEGLIVNVDGTAWNPGNGPGIYVYSDSEWTRIAGPMGGAQWEDIRFPATTVNPPGTASDPGVDTTYGWLLFDASSTEVIFLIAQLPHGWEEGTTLKPHVHWCKTTSATGNVVWQLDYRWSPIGETMDGSWTTLSDYTPDVSDSDTAYHHALTGLGDISGTGKQISDCLIMKLSRIGGDGNDTYGADAAMIEFDIHIQLDSFGSTALYDKDGA